MSDDFEIPLTAPAADPEPASGSDDPKPADLGARELGKADTSRDDGDREPADSGDDKPKAKADDEPEEKPKPKGRKRKVKRFGEELDIDFDGDPDELAKLLSIDDDFEFTLSADKQEYKKTLADLKKDDTLRSAAHKRMQEATELQNRLNAWPQNLRNDPDQLESFLRDVVGFENPFEPLERKYLAYVELQNLNDPNHQTYNPQEYARRISEQAAAEERRKLAAQRQQEQQREQRRQVAAARKQFDEALPKAMKAHGLELDDLTWAIIHRIVGPQMKASGMEHTPENIAYEVNRRVQELTASRIPADPAALVEMLGPDKLKALYKHAADEEKARQRKVARGEGKTDDDRPAKREKSNEVKSVSEILRMR